jgi:hypothetical protein
LPSSASNAPSVSCADAYCVALLSRRLTLEKGLPNLRSSPSRSSRQAKWPLVGDRCQALTYVPCSVGPSLPDNTKSTRSLLKGLYQAPLYKSPCCSSRHVWACSTRGTKVCDGWRHAILLCTTVHFTPPAPKEKDGKLTIPVLFLPLPRSGGLGVRVISSHRTFSSTHPPDSAGRSLVARTAHAAWAG